ncbi:MAG: GNAT family N-acetyltransferase [Bacteroidota bacterium]
MNVEKVELRPLTLEDYQMLRATTDWVDLEDDKVSSALERDLFSVCFHVDAEAVGMGRVVGDGAIYFYIQDVIVHPKCQGIGIGKLIMEKIMAFLQHSISGYAFIGLMAAEGVGGFYHQFGFRERSLDALGMYMVMNVE